MEGGGQGGGGGRGGRRKKKGKREDRDPHLRRDTEEVVKRLGFPQPSGSGQSSNAHLSTTGQQPHSGRKLVGQDSGHREGQRQGAVQAGRDNDPDRGQRHGPKVKDKKTNRQPVSRDRDRQPVSKPASSQKVSFANLQGKELLRALAEHRIFELKKKNPSFPNAKYFCRLCEYHLDRPGDCERHVSESRHQRKKEALDMEGILENIPAPSRQQVRALDSVVTDVVNKEGLSPLQLTACRLIGQRLQALLSKFLDGVTVRHYGSTLTGVALKKSDVNLEVCGPGEAPLLLISVFNTLQQHGAPDFTDAQNNFSAKIPVVVTRDRLTSSEVVITVRGETAVLTSRLLELYTSADPRVQPLSLTFRMWAKVCHLDRQEEGTLPPFAFNILVVYFLIHVQPPVLPYLPLAQSPPEGKGVPPLTPEDKLDYHALKTKAQSWQSENTDSVGSLWLQLLRFYCLEFDNTSVVVSLLQSSPLTRQAKKWHSKKLAIEDPFMPKKNIANSLANSLIFEYYQSCLRKAYEYFGMPRDKNGLVKVCLDSLRALANKKTETLLRENMNTSPSSSSSPTPSPSSQPAAPNTPTQRDKKKDKKDGQGDKNDDDGDDDDESEGGKDVSNVVIESNKFIFQKLASLAGRETNTATPPDTATPAQSAASTTKQDDTTPKTSTLAKPTPTTSTPAKPTPNTTGSGADSSVVEGRKSAPDSCIETSTDFTDSALSEHRVDSASTDLDVTADSTVDSRADSTTDSRMDSRVDSTVDSRMDSRVDSTADSRADSTCNSPFLEASSVLDSTADTTGSFAHDSSLCHPHRDTSAVGDVSSVSREYFTAIEQSQDASSDEYQTPDESADPVAALSEGVKQVKVTEEEGQGLRPAAEERRDKEEEEEEDSADWYSFTEHDLTGGKGPAVICGYCDQEGHIKAHCPDDRLPPVVSLPPITRDHLEMLNNVIVKVMYDFAPNEMEHRKRQMAVTDLERFIQQTYPDAQLSLFGSSCNGFGFRQSDLDICMTFKGKTVEDIDVVEVIEGVSGQLMHKGRQYLNVLAIPTAKVPIVKFYLRDTRLEADISLYNTLAQCNTRLLWCYSQIDRRVKVLGYAVKVFAKICDIGDASRGSLSSYGYILMMLHYLQQCQPPVIPVLQQLCAPGDEDKAKPQVMVEGCNTWFYDNLHMLPQVWRACGRNQQGVGELWVGFLRYYLEVFDWKTRVVSVRELSPLTKFSKMWTGTSIAIEDPFDLNHNLGGGLSRKMNNFIYKTFVKGRKHFGTPFHLNRELLMRYANPTDYFFDQNTLMDGRPPNDRGCRLCGKIGHMVKDCPNRSQNKKRHQETKDNAGARGQQQQQQQESQKKKPPTTHPTPTSKANPVNQNSSNSQPIKGQNKEVAGHETKGVKGHDKVVQGMVDKVKGHDKEVKVKDEGKFQSREFRRQESKEVKGQRKEARGQEREVECQGGKGHDREVKGRSSKESNKANSMEWKDKHRDAEREGKEERKQNHREEREAEREGKEERRNKKEGRETGKEGRETGKSRQHAAPAANKGSGDVTVDGSTGPRKANKSLKDSTPTDRDRGMSRGQSDLTSTPLQQSMGPGFKSPPAHPRHHQEECMPSPVLAVGSSLSRSLSAPSPASTITTTITTPTPVQAGIRVGGGERRPASGVQMDVQQLFSMAHDQAFRPRPVSLGAPPAHLSLTPEQQVAMLGGPLHLPLPTPTPNSTLHSPKHTAESKTAVCMSTLFQAPPSPSPAPSSSAMTPLSLTSLFTPSSHPPSLKPPAPTHTHTAPTHMHTMPAHSSSAGVMRSVPVQSLFSAQGGVSPGSHPPPPDPPPQSTSHAGLPSMAQAGMSVANPGPGPLSVSQAGLPSVPRAAHGVGEAAHPPGMTPLPLTALFPPQQQPQPLSVRALFQASSQQQQHQQQQHQQQQSQASRQFHPGLSHSHQQSHISSKVQQSHHQSHHQSQPPSHTQSQPGFQSQSSGQAQAMNQQQNQQQHQHHHHQQQQHPQQQHHQQQQHPQQHQQQQHPQQHHHHQQQQHQQFLQNFMQQFQHEKTPSSTQSGASHLPPQYSQASQAMSHPPGFKAKPSVTPSPSSSSSSSFPFSQPQEKPGRDTGHARERGLDQASSSSSSSSSLSSSLAGFPTGPPHAPRPPFMPSQHPPTSPHGQPSHTQGPPGISGQPSYGLKPPLTQAEASQPSHTQGPSGMNQHGYSQPVSHPEGMNQHGYSQPQATVSDSHMAMWQQQQLFMQQRMAWAMAHGMVPPGFMSQGVMAPGPMSQGVMAPGPMSQGVMAPGSMSQGLVPPGSMSQGVMAPGSMSQGVMAPGSMSQGVAPPFPACVDPWDGGQPSLQPNQGRPTERRTSSSSADTQG